MNRVAINILGLNIYWYSIFVLTGMIIGSLLIFKEAKKQGIDKDVIIDYLFYGLIIGILGARIYYVVFNLDYYLSNPSEILAIWNGGLAIHGGIIATLLFTIIYTKKKNINLLKLTDICVVGLIIGQAIGRWGNFFNGEAFGKVTTLSSLQNMHIPKFIIDGMLIEGSYRQPTFLYESIFCLIGFIILLLVRKYYKKLKVGQLTSIYLIWYGIERLIIEYFRSDSLMIGPLKVAQLVSILFIITGIIILVIKNKELYHNNKEDK